MAQRGGARPGAGRKLSPETVLWREWQRQRIYEDREEHYQLALRLAKKGNTRLLEKIYDKTWPTPHDVDVRFEGLPADGIFRIKTGE